MNEITDTSRESATPSIPDAAAREALTGARSDSEATDRARARLKVLADIIDHHDHHCGEIRARLSRPFTINNPQAIAAILYHHEARRAARSTSVAPLALLLDSRAGAR